jgi:hypothetical protein
MARMLPQHVCSIVKCLEGAQARAARHELPFERSGRSQTIQEVVLLYSSTSHAAGEHQKRTLL